MDKTQEKFFKLLKLLDDCRNKLLATYNLFKSCLGQTKEIKMQLGIKYEQMIDYRDELNSILYSNKQAQFRISKISTDSEKLKNDYEEQRGLVEYIMDDCERCRKTYKHEVNLCCQTYNLLKNDGVNTSVVKGYRQQVKLIRAILNKIDNIKDEHNQLESDINKEKQMFDKLYNDLCKKISEIK